VRLQEFGPDIWTADGPPVHAFGPVVLPTRTIVVRLDDGALWINSPVAATRSEMDMVAQLGPVRYLVAPTPLHVWRLPSWKAAFPEAQLWVPDELGDKPPAEWARDLDQVIFRGNLFLDEIEFLHKKSRTLIFADFIQNYPAQPRRPWLNALMSLAGVLGGGVPRDIRLSFFGRSLARSSLRRILCLDFDKLIVAHGACVESYAKAFVEKAFRWLLP
jgi:hypothetical protein